ncbi:hypothetical protein CROQUDRAFT_643015 [Cronartium quercuum f. sp. fusiforme G11]|uniref:Uncharacterized protein n=1 Tax=Cronartium quercuum f. sp. fusiforme G11 TaxID=708437 RepID=A0A9P6NH67_9BASI|nr:hypothetical protein CROQUDRAFT_643015 [Cronartium quercuum f. sp. fusiforme G11]
MPSQPLVICTCSSCFGLSFIDSNGNTKQGKLISSWNKSRHLLKDQDLANAPGSTPLLDESGEEKTHCFIPRNIQLKKRKTAHLSSIFLSKIMFLSSSLGSTSTPK